MVKKPPLPRTVLIDPGFGSIRVHDAGNEVFLGVGVILDMPNGMLRKTRKSRARVVSGWVPRARSLSAEKRQSCTRARDGPKGVPAGITGVEDPDTGIPRTFAQHLVDIGSMEQEAAAQLVSLFERARYAGDRELSKDDAMQARERSV